MKKMINKTVVEGVLLEKELRSGVAEKSGVKYIAGKLHLETEDGNTISVELYEGEKTSKGLENPKFATLKSIYDNAKTKHSGAEKPTLLKINSAFGTNDWYNKEGELVCSLVNKGGYINVVSATSPKSEFEVDVVIQSVVPEIRNEVETGRAYVNGLIFNYANQALPAKFVVDNPKGVAFFAALPKNTFTRVWGKQVNSSVTSERMEESAFGDAKVAKTSYTRKEFVITGAQVEPYDDMQLTADELNTAIQNRNLAMAELKNRTVSKETSKPAFGGFSF